MFTCIFEFSNSPLVKTMQNDAGIYAEQFKAHIDRL